MMLKPAQTKNDLSVSARRQLDRARSVAIAALWPRPLGLAGTLTGVYLVSLGAVWAVLRWGSDCWWPATLASFAPRWVYALPWIFLFAWTLISHRRLIAWQLMAAVVLIHPILGACLSPTALLSAPVGDRPLRLVTFNAGGGRVAADDVVRLVRQCDAEVLLLQECSSQLASRVVELLDWSSCRSGHLCVASRHKLGEASVVAWQRPPVREPAGLACPLTVRKRTITIVNVHLPTPRPGLQAICDRGLRGLPALRDVQQHRRLVAGIVSDWAAVRDEPVLLAGDFNMPVDSVLYGTCWSGWKNAFSESGCGFGYSKYTAWHGIRIDHVLFDSTWSARRCRVERDLGGDHRPIFAELRWER